jgi:hypothetical protein
VAHQIVATSVPRGLDGVSGYQTVLKSAGIPPRVFDRLKARSGYSHRYPHGDSRNPVIYVHRIEELAGGRWHVLGCIRDAGSDHTGRSNFLAHMLAIDSTEARGKPGGPAAAALARGCFLDKWDRPPEPAAAPKILVVADRPAMSGDVSAWTAAGLDPGLAGDLAAAAMANRKVVIVTRPGDDVLALFADALRLVEPSKRWAVTFNTCAIEDFDGIWKAVRADLAESKDLRDGRASIIDLSTDPRASADPYAQFARGEAVLLPWQKPTAAAEPEQRPDESDKDTSRRPLTTPGRPPGDTDRSASTALTHTGDRGPRKQRHKVEENEPRRLNWQTIAIAALGLLLLGTLAAIPLRQQLQERFLGPNQLPKTLSGGSSSNVDVRPAMRLPIDSKQTPEYQAATQLKETLARLAKGVDAKTYRQYRDEAGALIKRIDILRSGDDDKAPLKIMPTTGDGEDPRLAGENAIQVCDRVARLLETTTGLELKAAEKAEADLKDAVARLARAEKQVEALAAKERKELDDKAMARDAEARQQRKLRAFENFRSIGQTLSLPTAPSSSSADLGGGRPTQNADVNKLDLGPFQFTDLVEPTFRLAVPRDTIEGQDFKADILKVDGVSEARWQISYLPTGVGIAANREAPKPLPLAYLISRDGRLFLEVPRSTKLNTSPFAMLRRSVILVEAKDPSTPQAPAIREEIRLVKPTKVPPLEIDLFAEQHQELKVVPPAGIARTVGQGTLELPTNSLRLEADFPNGKTESLELPKDVRKDLDPGIGKWDIPLVLIEFAEGNLTMSADIKLSLPQATMTVRTVAGGQLATRYPKEKIKQNYIDKPAATLKNYRISFRQLAKEGKNFSRSVRENEILEWFKKPLKLSQPMGGPETILGSFESFLQEEAVQGVKTFGEFQENCRAANDDQEWKEVFTQRIDKWSDWFWAKFEKQYRKDAEKFQGALAAKYQARIKAITSLAYDESGKIYEVPLVVGEGSHPVPGVAQGLGSSDGLTPDGSADSLPATGSSGSPSIN